MKPLFSSITEDCSCPYCDVMSPPNPPVQSSIQSGVSSSISDTSLIIQDVQTSKFSVVKDFYGTATLPHQKTEVDINQNVTTDEDTSIIPKSQTNVKKSQSVTGLSNFSSSHIGSVSSQAKVKPISMRFVKKKSYPLRGRPKPTLCPLHTEARSTQEQCGESTIFMPSSSQTEILKPPINNERQNKNQSFHFNTGDNSDLKLMTTASRISSPPLLHAPPLRLCLENIENLEKITVSSCNNHLTTDCTFNAELDSPAASSSDTDDRDRCIHPHDCSSATSSSSVSVGDVVWAKIAGNPWWPAKVLEVINSNTQVHKSHIHRNRTFKVHWYPSGQISYLKRKCIARFEENYKNLFKQNIRRPDYRSAVEQALSLLDISAIEQFD